MSSHGTTTTWKEKAKTKECMTLRFLNEGKKMTSYDFNASVCRMGILYWYHFDCLGSNNLRLLDQGCW